MKRILITGEGSFVGASVRCYLDAFPDRYSVAVVDTKSDYWRSLDFSCFDSIFHVAGLAHSDVGNVSQDVVKEYYAVNCDLAVSVAQKAKAEGAKQFIFMSSSIVYGDSAPIGREKMIGRKTLCTPTNFYGDSKVRAEKALLPLGNEQFRVVILRCPMIYGKGGKGNFPILEKVARRTLLFPKVDNRRSMLYIGNLTEFVRLMIENEEDGIFWPCNREWGNTSEIVRMIAECRGRKVKLVPGLGWVLKGLSHLTGYVNKAFGNLAYEEHLGDYVSNYRLYSLAQSIEEMEA